MGQDEQRILDYKLFVTVSPPSPPLHASRRPIRVRSRGAPPHYCLASSFRKGGVIH